MFVASAVRQVHVAIQPPPYQWNGFVFKFVFYFNEKKKSVFNALSYRFMRQVIAINLIHWPVKSTSTQLCLAFIYSYYLPVQTAMKDLLSAHPAVWHCHLFTSRLSALPSNEEHIVPSLVEDMKQSLQWQLIAANDSNPRYLTWKPKGCLATYIIHLHGEWVTGGGFYNYTWLKMRTASFTLY